MHKLIEARRRRLGRAAPVEAHADYTQLRELVGELEAKVAAVCAMHEDPRLASLSEMIASARVIVDIVAAGGPFSARLLPSASATLIQARSIMLMIAEDIVRREGTRANPGRDQLAGAA